MDEETINGIKQLKDLFVSQLAFLMNDGLILFLKKNEDDRSSSVKIIFKGVLGFHDTGMIHKKISYVAFNEVLGFKYASYAAQHNQVSKQYGEVVFTTESEKGRVELIVACKNLTIEESS